MINASDFHKYGSKPMTRWIETNSKLEIKNAEWKKIMKKGDPVTHELVESKQVETMGAAQEFEDQGDMAKLSLDEGWAKKKMIAQVGAYIEYTNRSLKLGGKNYIQRSKEGLAKCPARWMDRIAMLYMEYSDTALASVPTINGRAVIDSIGGDGLTLAHTAHTHQSNGGNTYSNKTASFTSLTQDALQGAVTAVSLWVNDSGQYMDAEITELQVPVTLQYKAYELCHSKTKSETANRADNALNEHYGPKPTVIKQLVNQTEWFCKTNCPNDFELAFGWEPKQDSEYIKSKGGKYVHYLDFLVAHGCNDPRGYYFNKAA